MKKILLVLFLSSTCQAGVEEVADHAAQTLWATNEILQTKIEPDQIAKLVDITFPCKIIYQTTSGDVHVLKPESSSDDDQCKNINRYNQNRLNDNATRKWANYSSLALLTISLSLNVFLISSKRHGHKKANKIL
jgi:hypothetical protein